MPRGRVSGLLASESAALSLAILLGGIFLSFAALAKPAVTAEVEQAGIQRIAFAKSGDAWMATRTTLYRVHEGKAEVVDAVSGKRDAIALAADGRTYAKLVTGGGLPGGLFAIQLMTVPKKKPIAELRLKEFPFGFGALFLGGAGTLIVTVSPLDDPEGLRGRFLYTFWGGDGDVLSQVTVDGRPNGAMSDDGRVLLLLGEKGAVAFSYKGKELWRLNGRFRDGVVADNGKVALLNPAEIGRTSEVSVFQNGKLTLIKKMSSPVFALALAADGSIGAIGTDNGELSLISPGSCKPSSCTLKPVHLHGGDRTFLITAMRFVTQRIIGIGMIQRAGDAPPFTFPSGRVLALNTSGQVLFETNVKLDQPATWAPGIDATYGIPSFAARTPQRATFVRLNK